METKSATSESNPPTGTKSTASNSNHPHSEKLTAAKRASFDEFLPFEDVDDFDEDLIMPLDALNLNQSRPQLMVVPLNTLNLKPDHPPGIMQSVLYFRWSDGDLFKGIEKQIMDHLEIDPQERERTYFRIFTDKKLFNEIIRWYGMPYPSKHVIVHSQKDIRPLFSDDTLDENKTGFVREAVGIFVQNRRSMWWLWPNKGKIKPPKR
ncbi:MAG: hypothetical protein JOS17DRAFT_769057, partial [Linnemannia elongata]